MKEKTVYFIDDQGEIVTATIAGEKDNSYLVVDAYGNEYITLKANCYESIEEMNG